MKITEGRYTTENSELLLVVNRVKYECHSYIKVDISLYNRNNGIFYSRTKNHKLYKNNINHWIKIPENKVNQDELDTILKRIKQLDYDIAILENQKKQLKPQDFSENCRIIDTINKLNQTKAISEALYYGTGNLQ